MLSLCCALLLLIKAPQGSVKTESLKMEKTYSVEANTFHKLVAWPNGKALDYESRDSRFDPWRDQFFARLLSIKRETSISANQLLPFFCLVAEIIGYPFALPASKLCMRYLVPVGHSIFVPFPTISFLSSGHHDYSKDS